MKLKTMKFSSEGPGSNSVKFCTSENFPLYGNGDKHVDTNHKIVCGGGRAKRVKLNREGRQTAKERKNRE